MHVACARTKREKKKNVFGPKIKCSVEIDFNFKCARSAEGRKFSKRTVKNTSTSERINALSNYGNSEYVGREKWEKK